MNTAESKRIIKEYSTYVADDRIVAKPLVSVLMWTFNHAEYIKQSLDSVLMQVTDFDYELVISDDCSTDGTTEILEEYQRAHPEKIRLILSKKNLFKLNVITQRLLYEGCSPYIALTHGDDFWIDEKKLQEQVDYLENHPSFSMCFHRVLIKNETADEESILSPPTQVKTVYELKDIVVDNFIHTCSVVFRNTQKISFPKWYFKCPIGDWPLHVINAKKGPIGYLKEVMAVYRVHQGGVWSSTSAIKSRATRQQVVSCLDRFLNYRFHEIIEMNKSASMVECLLESFQYENQDASKIILSKIILKKNLGVEGLTRLLKYIEIGRKAIGLDLMIKAYACIPIKYEFDVFLPEFKKNLWQECLERILGISVKDKNSLYNFLESYSS